MNAPRPHLGRAVRNLTCALHDYHAASLQMAQAYTRLLGHQREVRTALKDIVAITASATRPARVPPY